jgi:hypothetical protein
LIKRRLDHILGELDRGLGYITQHNPWFSGFNFDKSKTRDRRLKDLLLEVDESAVETPPCMPFTLSLLIPVYSSGCVRVFAFLLVPVVTRLQGLLFVRIAL